MKKRIGFMGVLTAAILTAGLFVGCGSAATEVYEDASAAYDSGTVSDEADAYYTDVYVDDGESGYSGDYSDEAAASEETGSVDLDGTETSSADQKLIVTWNLSIQTENYDQTLALIRDRVAAAGGYIESENETAYDDNERYDYLTIRIPTENADSWIDGVSDYGTVVNRSKNTEDVTLTYVDMESRLDALRAEQDTLLDMMETADNMTDIIAIQSELANVNADIESYESQLRVLDNQVNYTTVNMDISEVNREVATTQTFGQELRETFLNSMEGLGRFGRGFAIWLLGNSVVLLIIGGLVVGLIFMIKGIKKHHRKKKEKKNQTTES